VKSDPQVPGPGLRRPAPKKVATTVAQRGAALDSVWDVLAMLIVVLGAVGSYILLEIVRSVFQGRGNLIVSAGPFAQVNDAAALTAEREVGIRACNRLLADGATQFDPLGHL